MAEANVIDLQRPARLTAELRAIPGGRASLALPGARYTSADFYALEWERMWTKTWLLLGREDEMPEAGDYLVEEIGRESFLMVRQHDGEFKVFYNVCQHRGNRLANAGYGAVDQFRCAYHGWRYAIDGKLAWAQDPENFPNGNPCHQLQLAAVRAERFAGFIWINMDMEAISLQEYLGPVWQQWQAYSIENMQRYLALSVRLPCNWKVVQDNFNESYHLPATHPQTAEVVEDSYAATDFFEFEQGHGLMKMKGSHPSRRLEGVLKPLLGDYLRNKLQCWELNPDDFVGREFEARTALQQQIRKLGPERGYQHLAQLSDDQLTDYYHYTLFPNFAVSLTLDGFHFLRSRPHASDPNRCTLDNWFYALAPAAITTPAETPNGPVARDAIVERETFDYGTRSAGYFVDQDLSNMLGQQQGFRSRGYRGATLAGQEGRIAHYHATIDEYIDGKRPARLPT